MPFLFRIGLKAFANPAKNSDLHKLIKKIGKGIKISRDGNGNIFATRICDTDVIMKGYKNPENACFSKEIIEHMGRDGLRDRAARPPPMPAQFGP